MGADAGSSCVGLFARFHPRTVVVAHEMQQCMHERAAPGVADNVGTDDDVAELARKARRQVVAAVDRKRERIRRLVDAEMIALQCADLLGIDERQAELAFFDSLRFEHVTCERDRCVDVGFRGGSIDDLDVDHAHHLRRCVPVSSACSLYASTIRWTSLCRTTSWWPKRMNAIPSTEARMPCTWMRPEACSRGRSICVTSPVTTTFEPKPSRVRNICICSGLVFCASSRMMKESLSVLCVSRKSSVT